jgi:hypothetical protein
VTEELYPLESPRNAQGGNFTGRQFGNLLALENDAPRGRRKYSRHLVYEGGFTGAIGADEPRGLPFRDRKIDTVVGDNAAESLRKRLCFEDIGRHALSPSGPLGALELSLELCSVMAPGFSPHRREPIEEARPQAVRQEDDYHEDDHRIYYEVIILEAPDVEAKQLGKPCEGESADNAATQVAQTSDDRHGHKVARIEKVKGSGVKKPNIWAYRAPESPARPAESPKAKVLVLRELTPQASAAISSSLTAKSAGR